MITNDMFNWIKQRYLTENEQGLWIVTETLQNIDSEHHIYDLRESVQRLYHSVEYDYSVAQIHLNYANIQTYSTMSACPFCNQPFDVESARDCLKRLRETFQRAIAIKRSLDSILRQISKYLRYERVR